MSNGTMIRNRPRVRAADGGDLADHRPRAFVARVTSAARVMGAATAVAVVGAGMFALLAPGQTVRGEDPRLAVAATAGPEPAPAREDAAVPAAAPAPEPPVVRGATPGEVVETTRPAPEALPAAKNLTAGARRTALVTYLERAGVPLATAPTVVVRAARETCAALDGGTEPGDFVADLARVSGYTAQQSASFVAGAAHFYCPRHSAVLAR